MTKARKPTPVGVPNMSQEERDARTKLAACYRMVAKLGMDAVLDASRRGRSVHND